MIIIYCTFLDYSHFWKQKSWIAKITANFQLLHTHFFVFICDKMNWLQCYICFSVFVNESIRCLNFHPSVENRVFITQCWNGSLAHFCWPDFHKDILCLSGQKLLQDWNFGTNWNFELSLTAMADQISFFTLFKFGSNWV